MAAYSIKDLEMLSNVKAHTIRIWEQRYHLLTPDRTDTNIRYYDDEQLKKLLNVCTLISQGLRISKIARLSNKEIGGEIEKILNGLTSEDAELDAMVNHALIAVTQYDELSFEKTFSLCLEKMGMVNCYKKFIYPLLVRTGLMWNKDDVIPAQEHFVSNIIRRKLFSAIDTVPLNDNADQTWVLFLPEHEKHDIGLLFAAYLLRLRGRRVIYLGQEVPLSNLADVVTACKPSYLYTCLVRNYPPGDIGRMLESLVCDFGDVNICVAGTEERLEGLPKNKRIIAVTDVASLEGILADKI